MPQQPDALAATLASESAEPFVAPTAQCTGADSPTAPPETAPIAFSFANPTGPYQNDDLWNAVLRSQWRQKPASTSIPTTAGSRTSTRSKESGQGSARIAKESKE